MAPDPSQEPEYDHCPVQVLSLGGPQALGTAQSLMRAGHGLAGSRTLQYRLEVGTEGENR